MSLTKKAIKNDGDPWAIHKRYKVNDVVNHLEVVYQNITGINSEPADDSENWLKVSASLDAPIIIVNGNPFTLKKHPQNNTILNASILEDNDIITNGFWDNTEFWNSAIYLGSDKDIKTNWIRLSYTEEIPLI